MIPQPIPGTTLSVRSYGHGRQRIVIIEPTRPTTPYDPIRVDGTAVILYNSQTRKDLAQYYAATGRPYRQAHFPGGMGSKTDDNIKTFLLK